MINKTILGESRFLLLLQHPSGENEELPFLALFGCKRSVEKIRAPQQYYLLTDVICLSRRVGQRVPPIIAFWRGCDWLRADGEVHSIGIRQWALFRRFITEE